jgi:hypothetical protein
MEGIIGSAVATGILGVQCVFLFDIKTLKALKIGKIAMFTQFF